MDFEQDAGTGDDDIAFGFDGALPDSAVSYSVIDTGFVRVLDKDNVLSNGANAPIPFTGNFTAGTFTDMADSGVTYLGSDAGGDNGFDLVISTTTAVPEPSSFLFLGLVACGGMACRWKCIIGFISDELSNCDRFRESALWGVASYGTKTYAKDGG